MATNQIRPKQVRSGNPNSVGLSRSSRVVAMATGAGASQHNFGRPNSPRLSRIRPLAVTSPGDIFSKLARLKDALVHSGEVIPPSAVTGTHVKKFRF